MSKLDDYLGDCLHVSRGRPRKMPDTLREAMAADPELRGAVMSRKQELDTLNAQCLGQLERRCAISAAQLRGIEEAL